MRILIIDDSKTICYSFAELLRIKSHDAEYISDAQEAYDYVKNNDLNEFDYIIVDLYLNGIAGIDIFNIIKDKGLKNKVIFMSGCNEKSEIFQKALGLKVPVIVKKFDPVQLIDSINEGSIIEYTRKKLLEREIVPTY